MKKSICALIILLSIIPQFCFSQEFQTFDLPEVFKKGVEISSIAIVGNDIYLPTESCNKIYILSIKDPNYIDSIALNFDMAYEIEGLAFYNQRFFFFTNEKNNSLHIYDLKKNEESQINYAFNSQPKNIDTYRGLEGMAYNRQKKILYILREKNTSSEQAYIYCFSVKDSSGIFNLEQLKINGKDKVTIDLNHGFRYSDFCLSEDSKSLRLLLTSKGQYYIESLNLDNTSMLPMKSSYKIGELIPKDISHYANKLLETNSSNNLEAIYLSNGRYYIASDNHMTSSPDCETVVNLKTGLISIKLW
ncbi:SdiA-regulated domain-containing protein [Arcticibacterium luteifluviistationis]|uniref:Phytase-like domain-containing protein n=1 Tax=Arcticibacterium luteifluviistationis TaxID=1784714 RepID=A0A2Z4G9Y4_9BACT|nr:SdiA-regulated domain-containing protein [Arcticibacterium luteifluviistationis]AWV97900.1 hypothetical protein DJ013_06855 [Arcticibacterium luteifluviistationis]